MHHHRLFFSALALLSGVGSALARLEAQPAAPIVPRAPQPTAGPLVPANVKRDVPSPTRPISVIQATRSTAPITFADPDFGGYDGSPNTGQELDVGAGAGNGYDSPSGFNLSTGGMIGICVVVVLVVIFGIATTVLYVMAKRNNWKMREQIKHASRRLTGRKSTVPGKHHGTIYMTSTTRKGSDGSSDVEKGGQAKRTVTTTELEPQRPPKPMFPPPPKKAQRGK